MTKHTTKELGDKDSTALCDGSHVDPLTPTGDKKCKFCGISLTKFTQGKYVGYCDICEKYYDKCED